MQRNTLYILADDILKAGYFVKPLFAVADYLCIGLW
jgi:hypothetical protein